tara:strand:- start:4080 stop:4397 length:318 start_codon:yes stop_codon:yes gene_type:complete
MTLNAEDKTKVMDEGEALMFQSIQAVITETCVDYGVTVPEIFGSDNMTFTDPKEKTICVCPELDTPPQEQADHIFGHYLADMHNLSPDFVADVIAKLIRQARRQD